MHRSIGYYARWFLQYTGYFTHGYLIEEKGKHKWFLPPQLTGCFTHEIHKGKGQFDEGYPMMERKRFKEKKFCTII